MWIGKAGAAAALFLPLSLSLSRSLSLSHSADPSFLPDAAAQAVSYIRRKATAARRKKKKKKKRERGETYAPRLTEQCFVSLKRTTLIASPFNAKLISFFLSPCTRFAIYKLQTAAAAVSSPLECSSFFFLYNVTAPTSKRMGCEWVCIRAL